MRRNIQSFMKKHRLLHPKATVLLGVSGGPDSMALLHFYHSIQSEWDIRMIALSIDHQLRGEESQADLAYVEHMCEAWNIPFKKASVNVLAYKQTNKVSTQVAARQLRYLVFEQMMATYEADFLVLGHHADDQVETMFMEWMRSAGSNAVLGIPVKRSFSTGFIVRPLLCVTKDMILDYCKQEAIYPRLDPSNEDISYTRNYIRKHIIPDIKERNPNIHHTVQRLSETLQEDEHFFQTEAKKIAKKIVLFQESKREVSFNIEQFKRNERSLQRRVYHLILNYLYHELPENLSYIHEEIFLALLEAKESSMELDFPRHLKIEKVYERIIFYFSERKRPMTPFLKELHIPSDIILPQGLKLSTCYTNRQEETDANTYICSASAVQLPLMVRTRKDGDRLRLRGLQGSKKLKDFFIDKKIPRKQRDSYLLVTDNTGEVLWVIGLQKAAPKANVGNSPYIQMKITKHEGAWEDLDA